MCVQMVEAHFPTAWDICRYNNYMYFVCLTLWLCFVTYIARNIGGSNVLADEKANRKLTVP